MYYTSYTRLRITHYALCIIGLFLPLLVWGKTYSPKDVPDPKKSGQWEYVSNPDGIIGEEDVVYLNKCARMLEEKTQAEMAVVAIQSIGDQDMFDFTYQLFQLWGVGKEGKNTGVLVCFVLDSHDIRIMTGQGIEGVLPDAVCKRIIEEDMIPSFREEKYGEGLCLGALRIYEKCTSGDAPEELLNVKSVTRRNKVQQEEPSWLGSLIGGKVKEVVREILFVFLVIIVLIALSCWAVYHSHKCPKCGRHTLSTRQKTLVAATYAATGVGLTIKSCKHCGYKHEERFTIPKLTKTTTYTGGGHYGGGHHHSSGSSFGGFGGGSWGGGSTMGGGAGGKW